MKYIKTFENKNDERFSAFEEIALKNIGCEKSTGGYNFNYKSESTGDEIVIIKLSEKFKFSDHYRTDPKDFYYKVIITKTDKRKRIIKDFANFNKLIEFINLYIPEIDKDLKKYNL